MKPGVRCVLNLDLDTYVTHSFSLKCDKCCLCYSTWNRDFTICTCANHTFLWFLTHLCNFSSIFSWSGCLILDSMLARI